MTASLIVSWSGSSTLTPSLSHLVEFSRPSLLFITSSEMLASLISSLLSSSAGMLGLEERREPLHFK